LLVAAATVFAVLICLRVVAADSTAAACTVRLRPQAAVKGAAPILADIADLSGDDKALLDQLAHMPLGSISDARLLSRADVLALIKVAIPDLVDVQIIGAEFTRVSIATRAPEATEIAAILKAYLASVTPWKEEEIEIRSIDNLKAIALPEGEIQLRVVSHGAPLNFRSALVSVEVSLNGKSLRTFWVKADVRVRAQVVQAARPVSYRSVLKADDLREALCDIEDPHSAYIRTAAEAVGMIAKRALGQGELLNLNCVDGASLVRSGETVRLLVQSGSISMTVLARALQNGKLGDPVKVKNIDSDRVVTAVVTGRCEVRVAN